MILDNSHWTIYKSYNARNMSLNIDIIMVSRTNLQTLRHKLLYLQFSIGKLNKYEVLQYLGLKLCHIYIFWNHSFLSYWMVFFTQFHDILITVMSSNSSMNILIHYIIEPEGTHIFHINPFLNLKMTRILFFYEQDVDEMI